MEQKRFKTDFGVYCNLSLLNSIIDFWFVMLNNGSRNHEGQCRFICYIQIISTVLVLQLRMILTFSESFEKIMWFFCD